MNYRTASIDSTLFNQSSSPYVISFSKCLKIWSKNLTRPIPPFLHFLSFFCLSVLHLSCFFTYFPSPFHNNIAEEKETRNKKNFLRVNERPGKSEVGTVKETHNYKQNTEHRFHATYKTNNVPIPEPMPIHINVLSKQEMQLGQKKDNKFLKSTSK
jgi:hypothetical protein